MKKIISLVFLVLFVVIFAVLVLGTRKTGTMRPADAITPAAGICEFQDGDTVHVEIAPDIPNPRCSKIRPHQKIAFTNSTEETIAISLGDEALTIPAGATETIRTPADTYLAPGVHHVALSYYAGSGPSLWVLPYGGGVFGSVLLSPVCPVERIPPDPNCAPRGYETSLKIFSIGANGAETLFAESTTDAGGNFMAHLPAGRYILRAYSGDMFPRCEDQGIEIRSDEIAGATITCDTGIR
jgi:hypothetical protein